MKLTRVMIAILAVLILAGCAGDRTFWESNGQYGKEGERKIWDRNGQMKSGEREFWVNKEGEKVFK